MFKKIFMLCSCVVVLTAGCLSVDYQGETYAPTENVKFYSTVKEVPEKFEIMGKAVCSGNYISTSKEDIVKEFIKQAEEKGADAVLLHEYAVVPAGSVREQQLLNMNASNKIWGDSGRAVSGWNELEKDFDVRYGTVGKKNSAPAPSTSSYRRIIRVEFLKFKPAPKQP
jgi:hypothetical protein